MCVWSICTAKKRTSSFLSLCPCLSFVRSSPFFCVVVFPLHGLFCSLSLFSLLSFSPPVVALCGCFLFSLSLTLSCDRLCDPSSLIGKCGCVSRVSNGCQRLAEVTTTAFSQFFTVTFWSSQSLRRRVGTLIVF